jgi:hypothetical protein
METLIVPEKTGCSTLLLIDYFVKDYSVLIDSTNATTLPILYSYQNSKTQLLEVLRSKFVTINRVGLLFTQGNANLFLDKKHFFVQENVDFMVSLIQEFSISHIDFLACETLSYSVWSKYYDTLHQATGVTVGASINKTGNRRFESDWIMENTGENIELVYFTVQVELYKYLLDSEKENDNDNDDDKIDDKIIVK